MKTQLEALRRFFTHIVRAIPPVWMSILLYFSWIAVAITIFRPEKNFNEILLTNRVIAIFLLIVTLIIKKHLSPKVFQTLTFITLYTLLSFVYNETAVYNTILFPFLDEKLMLADQHLFGFQPAILFPQTFHQCFFNELFYLGYFSYYLMPLVILFLLYKNIPQKIEEFSFVIITSFLIYYILFMLFPAAGPQFFFETPFNKIEACGPFGNIVQLIQKYGESPTGAFPSSHVGVCLIILIWLFQNFKKYFLRLLPVAILLIFSTVYIKAHYAVDVIAGIISAPVIIF